MSDQITLKMILLDQFTKGKITSGSFPAWPLKVLENIALCRTDYYELNKSVCEQCGCTEIHYGTCNNLNYPACGEAKRKRWITEQNEKAIAATAFHIIFTVPDKFLNRFALHDPRFFYNAIFDASAKAVKKLSKNPKYFGAVKAGFFSFLHTWESTLIYHPHIHMVLYGARLDEYGNLVTCSYGTI